MDDIERAMDGELKERLDWRFVEGFHLFWEDWRTHKSRLKARGFRVRPRQGERGDWEVMFDPALARARRLSFYC
jgi:hypothetical protein